MSVVSPTRLRRCYSTAFFEFLRDEHGNGDCLELRNEARAGSGPSDVAPDGAVDFACPDRALQGSAKGVLSLRDLTVTNCQSPVSRRLGKEI
jgi:hypothetical protein